MFTPVTGKSSSVLQDLVNKAFQENLLGINQPEDNVELLQVKSKSSLNKDTSHKMQDHHVKCGDCGISFKSQGTLENHQKKYKCGNILFSKRKSMHSNWNNYLCDLCGFSTNNQVIIDKHTCTILPLRECDKCPYTSRILTKLDFHNTFQHKAPGKCSICDYKSKNKSTNIHAAKYTMLKHMDMHNVGIFECFECGDTFNVRQRLDYHIKAKHCPNICQECSKEESSAYKLKQHIKKLHNMS